MTRFGSEIRALQRAELKIRTPTSPPRPSPGAEASRIDWGSCEETTSPRQSGGMFPLIHETLPTFTSKFIYREVDEQCLKSVHRGLTAAARGQINPPGGKRKTWVPSEPPRTHDDPPVSQLFTAINLYFLKAKIFTVLSEVGAPAQPCVNSVNNVLSYQSCERMSHHNICSQCHIE